MGDINPVTAATGPNTADSGTANITDVRNYSEPIRVYNYQMVLSPPAAITTSAANISLRCMSTVIPARSVNPIRYSLSKFTIGVTGKMTYSHEWPVTFLEGIDLLILTMMHTWLGLCFSPTLGSALGTDMPVPGTKGAATIFLLDTTDAQIWQANLYGIFPTSIADIEVASEPDELVRCRCTFWYDYWLDPTNPP